ncbi:serine hydrolase domain-containing protein [Novosphingobium humi]|uniref:Serine hydrolase n=1 Tax=Novosphingobium humi TaxID=2282397 RepID=A0ABY7U312_9SPHN|nr:serine hydrolase [Novosphingobium humi]WCT79877.1 serine hydrolase [Novosphingobium humi]
MTFAFRLAVGAMAGLLAGPTAVCAQQQLPAQLKGEVRSDVPVATQIMRWHMNDADVNSFAFRNMDQLFTTRLVGHSGAPSPLPKVERPMDFTYSFGGKTWTAQEALERTYTNALLIMKDGRIVTEIYRNGSNERTRFMGWSMTKSITSTLVGAALADGLIASLDDPITRYLPELKGGGYDGVTIRQILQMRSGVDYEERYDFANPGIAASNHINALVRNVARFADVARTIKRKSKPGEVFAYKTIDTAVLGWLIERVSGGSVAAYTARKLWEPLGAEADGFYIMDGEPGIGREFSGAGFNATLRDWARFGQMMLDQGVINGKRVVSADWVKAAQTPAGPEDGPEGGYGYQWWTMANSPAYSAIGLQGQYVYIDPASRTVVVKLSYFPPQDGEVSQETLAFLAAASAWKPQS